MNPKNEIGSKKEAYNPWKIRTFTKFECFLPICIEKIFFNLIYKNIMHLNARASFVARTNLKQNLLKKYIYFLHVI